MHITAVNMVRRLVLLTGLAGLLQPSLQQCANEWAQCGGIGYSGASCCVAGSTCSTLNPYYAQCVSAAGGATTTTTTTTTHTTTTSSRRVSSSSSSSSKSTTTTTTTTTTAPTTSASSVASSGSYSGPSDYTTTSTIVENPSHTQAAYPSIDASSCGAWTLVDNVCCPSYCTNNNESSDCSGGCPCGTPPGVDCMSGTMYPEVHSVSTSETWHYSRSTHFGLTDAGACGFGMYGLCTQGSSTASWTDPMLGGMCDAFCTAYPLLCQDPANITFRGNFAAPNGDYYTQFWSSLPGDLDNYLSCGECMEMVMTNPDGSLIAPGSPGYTPPVIVTIVDSCPCDANPKWCCGPGADHCGEIDFTYGCPLPSGSIHLDLSDIAMGRLQGNGSLNQGVIPTQYRRVPCPTLGNVYVWMHDGGGPYYFMASAVNSYGTGSLVNFEIQGSGQSAWSSLERDPDYTSSRPQERYGAWVIPQNTGPYEVPISVRLTSSTGEQIVAMNVITTFTAPASAPSGFWYIDLGVQFTR